MVLLRDVHKTTLSLIEEGEILGDMRPYLGMSAMGHSCIRYLWLASRWMFRDSYPQRIKRLFDRGHREEDAIIAELTRIGYTVTDQQEEFVGVYGHVMGHWDGKVIGVVEAPKTPHVLEMKTMNDKYFKDVMKRGVKSSKPVYYGQAQLYMKFSKLKRTLFIAVNKNDDAWYIERIRYDKTAADLLVRRAEHVMFNPDPPTKPYKSTWYECKFCSANHICHHGGLPERTCRSCMHVEPVPEQGWWNCSIKNEMLSVDEQKLACERYDRIYIP